LCVDSKLLCLLQGSNGLELGWWFG